MKPVRRNSRQSYGEKVVRAGKLDITLEQFNNEIGIKITAQIIRYHEEYVTPLQVKLLYPWYARLWAFYLRPICELYGLTPIDMTLHSDAEAVAAVRAEWEKQGLGGIDQEQVDALAERVDDDDEVPEDERPGLARLQAALAPREPVNIKIVDEASREIAAPE